MVDRMTFTSVESPMDQLIDLTFEDASMLCSQLAIRLHQWRVDRCKMKAFQWYHYRSCSVGKRHIDRVGGRIELKILR